MARIGCKPSGGRHRKNTYASETPATDGERVYVSFGGNVGLFCYSREGTLLWKQSWTPQPIYLDFGTASSPVVHDGRVYQLHDNEGESFLVALEARTGNDCLEGEPHGQRRAAEVGMGDAFRLAERAGRTEIVTVGRGLVISYDKRRPRALAAQGHHAGDAHPGRGRGPALRRSGSQGENSRPLFSITASQVLTASWRSLAARLGGVMRYSRTVAPWCAAWRVR